MPETVEIEAVEAVPAALRLEDQAFLGVIAPILADLGAIGIDNAELVQIVQHRRILVLHFDLQILLRAGFRRRFSPGTGLIEA